MRFDSGGDGPVVPDERRDVMGPYLDAHARRCQSTSVTRDRANWRSLTGPPETPCAGSGGAHPARVSDQLAASGPDQAVSLCDQPWLHRQHDAAHSQERDSASVRRTRRRGRGWPRRRCPRPAGCRAVDPATGNRPSSRRGRSRSTCVVNGRLRQTGKDAVRRAPSCVVSRVGFYVLQTSSDRSRMPSPSADAVVT